MTDDRRRYRKVYCRLWIHPVFRRLSSDHKVVMLNMLSGTQTNRIGLCLWSLAKASEETNLPVAKVKLATQTVCRTFEWAYDEANGVVWIPSWWKWNDVRENFKVMQGALGDLHEVPDSPLIQKFLCHLTYVPEGLRYLFTMLSEKRAIPEKFSDSGIQEQEQEQDQKQEQEQDSALVRGDDTAAAFEVFRSAYPASRRVGGKEGRRAFEGAVNGRDLPAQLSVMLAAIEQHRRSEQWRDPKFIPLMTTWLNQERWGTVLPESSPMGQSAKTAGNQAALERFIARKEGTG